jgi:hypothetical protein
MELDLFSVLIHRHSRELIKQGCELFGHGAVWPNLVRTWS